MKATEGKFQESKLEISTCLDQLHYLIKSNQASISFEKNRPADNKKEAKFTNRYTLGVLFPDESEAVVLKRELLTLRVEEYIESIRDFNFPKLAPMRVFCKQYSNCDVYIKFRIEIMSKELGGSGRIIVISFHFAEWKYKCTDYPFRRQQK